MTDKIEHLNEGKIHAWLDGELSPDESARVESHANACADCAALVAEARGLVAASSRVLSSLDAVPAGVVPGSSAGTDQLAALRARRAAQSRRWWRDRRAVAAASLILVAGVSSLVWRSSANQAPVMLESARAVDSASPIAGAPGPGPVATTAPAEAKAEAPPTRDRAMRALAVTPRSDSAVADAKVAAAGPVPVAAGVSAASELQRANAARQSVDTAIVAAARGEQSASVQPQLQDAGAPQRLAVGQQRDSVLPAPRPAAPPALRNRSVVDAAAFGAGRRAADTAPVAGGCYRLVMLMPGGVPRAEALADTVRLLEDPMPGRIDPSWRRATGAPGADMAWRMVDSVTAELRIRSANDSGVVRFRLAPGTAPDVSGLSGVRAGLAAPVVCR